MFLRCLLFIALGILWSITNIGYTIGYLSLITLFPYLFFIRRERFKNGIFLSLVFGTAMYLFYLQWMPETIESFFPEIKQYGSIFVAIGITLLIALYHGLLYSILYIATYFARSITGKYTDYILIPIIYSIGDYFYPKLFFDQIGYSLHALYPLTQVVDLTGVSILTFIVMLSNVSLLIFAEYFYTQKIKHFVRLSFPVLYSVMTACLITLSILYGFFRIQKLHILMEKSEKAKIGIVQESITGVQKRDRKLIFSMIHSFNTSSQQLLKEKPDLIVWPETSIPYSFPEYKKTYRGINKTKTPLLYGTLTKKYNIETKKTKYYNSFMLISADGENNGVYNKRKLLPFIEEFPFPRFNRLMRLYGLTNFTRGDAYVILKTGQLKIAANICYEDIIANYIRKSIVVDGQTANLLVNASNNSWFGESKVPYLHLHIAKFRAIENRRFFVRSTGTGYSSVIDPTGHIVYKSGLFTKEAVVREVGLLEIKTLYAKWGDWFIHLLSLCCSIFLLYSCIYLFTKRI